MILSLWVVGCGPTNQTPTPIVTPIELAATPNLATIVPAPPTATLTLTAVPLTVFGESNNGAIAFASDVNGNMEIYVMTVSEESGGDSSEWYRLTYNRDFDINPAWSPDGTQIAFISGRSGSSKIYVMNVEQALQSADGSAPQLLTTSIANDVTWSPDGVQIAFSSEQDGDAEIYVINIDGSGERKLTDNDADDVNPSWSPDGTEIAFTSKRDGRFQEIYVMNSDGSDQRRLTNNEANDHDPAWSPDGTQIAFSYDLNGNSEIYVMDADGSNRQQLTDHPNAMDWWPHWSPDGAQIVFCVLDQDNFGNLHDIYVVNADGSNLRQLTNDTADTWWPAWGS